MKIQRIGLATAAVAMCMLSACTTWRNMTGSGTSSDTARTSGSKPSAAASGGTRSGGTVMPPGATGTTDTTIPGADVGRMRGPTVPATAGNSMPTFRSYNECRAWLAQQGRALNQGAATGGEVSMADTDPCRNLPRS